MESNSNYKILKIYISEDSKYKGHNLYYALVIKLKEIGMAGVTVTRGLVGYGESKTIHNAKILDLSSSLPIIIEAIDESEKIDKAMPIIKQMVDKGLVMTFDVDVKKYGKNDID